ncbi:ATP-binding protein [Candidatus Woesearchaeota archaeon]|nr:ATP-binding protein [Candidatus Woesearchaeota archaeon]
MITEILVTPNEYFRAEHNTSSILGERGYNLERRLSSCGYTEQTTSSNKVYNALLSFFTSQEAVFQKYKEELGDVEALLLGIYLGAKVGKKVLSYENGKSSDEFKDIKIDFEKTSTDAISDIIKAYISKMCYKTKRETEAFTLAFFDWNIDSSLETMAKTHRGIYNKIKKKTAQIKGETYVIDFEENTRVNKKDNYVEISFEDPAFDERKKIRKVREHDYIAGHEDVKEEFRNIIKKINDRKRLNKRYNPGKIFFNYLLKGPPGTGKTTLIEGLSEEAGLLFHVKKGAELVSTYFGGSAINVNSAYKKIFKEVRDGNYEGAVFVIDEADGITGERSQKGADNSQMDMIVTTLNTCMLEYLFVPIITIFATNKPEKIDKAIRSRMKKLTMGYPKTPEEEIAIHRKIMEKMEANCQEGRIFGDVNISELLNFSQLDVTLKSGREIDRLYHETAIELDLTSPSELVTTAHLLAQFEKHKYNSDNEEE